jgi:hypothetical protein
VGGKSVISPASRRSNASSGRVYTCAVISPPSTVTAAPRFNRGKEHPGREPVRRGGWRQPVRQRDEGRGVKRDAGFLSGLARRRAPGSRLLAEVAVSYQGRVEVCRLDPSAWEHPVPGGERKCCRPPEHEDLKSSGPVAQHDHRAGRNRWWVPSRRGQRRSDHEASRAGSICAESRAATEPLACQVNVV